MVFFQIYALSFVSTTQKHDSQLPNKPYLSLARGGGGGGWGWGPAIAPRKRRAWGEGCLF